MEHIRATDIVYLNRRDFLKVAGVFSLSAAGSTMLEACSLYPRASPLEGDTLETTTVRLALAGPSVCLAPQYLAEEFLKQEGFTNVQYIEVIQGGVGEKNLASGDLDISMVFTALGVTVTDAGKPIKMLAGVNVGCFELFGTDQIQEIRDLKGKTIPVSSLESTQYAFLAAMLTYVGLDPNKDINWVTHPPPEAIQLLADNEVDAFLAFPPTAQELRAKKIGHVILNSMMDDPWSKYFCCMVGANPEFVQKNPVATKRALRAFLKATDVSATEPERAAKLMVDKGLANNYEYALEAIQEIPYDRWREYDPEDTLRFYALRLREAGLVKSNPEELIKESTDWSFLDELKLEMKQ